MPKEIKLDKEFMDRGKQGMEFIVLSVTPIREMGMESSDHLAMADRSQLRIYMRLDFQIRLILIIDLMVKCLASSPWEEV